MKVIPKIACKGTVDAGVEGKFVDCINKMPTDVQAKFKEFEGKRSDLCDAAGNPKMEAFMKEMLDMRSKMTEEEKKKMEGYKAEWQTFITCMKAIGV